METKKKIDSLPFDVQSHLGSFIQMETYTVVYTPETTISNFLPRLISRAFCGKTSVPGTIGNVTVNGDPDEAFRDALYMPDDKFREKHNYPYISFNDSLCELVQKVRKTMKGSREQLNYFQYLENPTNVYNEVENNTNFFTSPMTTGDNYIIDTAFRRDKKRIADVLLWCMQKAVYPHRNSSVKTQKIEKNINFGHPFGYPVSLNFNQETEHDIINNNKIDRAYLAQILLNAAFGFFVHGKPNSPDETDELVIMPNKIVRKTPLNDYGKLKRAYNYLKFKFGENLDVKSEKIDDKHKITFTIASKIVKIKDDGITFPRLRI